MSKKKMIAGLVLCAGAPVMAQVNDVAPTSDAILRANPTTRIHTEALGDPIAGPYNVENASNNGQLGVDHAFGHFWVSARDIPGTNHKVWKYTEDGTFVKAFDQDIASKASAWGYRDGASDEGANQLYFGWDGGGFVMHDYDAATGDISVNCTMTVPSVGTIRALARTPAGTFITKSFTSDIYEFDSTGATLNTWADPMSSYGCAYDAANDTYWWSNFGYFIEETDASMLLTGRFVDTFSTFSVSLNNAQGGLDIYADARSATGSAFVQLYQGTPDEVAVFEADAGAAAHNTTGPLTCNTPPPPPPIPCQITTEFTGGNRGNPGGHVYFDVAIGAEDLTMGRIEVNSITAAGTPFGWEIWTRPGTYVGGECTPAEWTLVGTGSGVTAGLGNPSPVTLDAPIDFLAGETFGMTMFDPTAAMQHEYTTGAGAASNAEISLRLGASQNFLWQCALFSPRTWNGTIYYETANCDNVCPCACNFNTTTGINVCDIFDFLDFQDGFVSGDPCACDINITTGLGVCDIFDFLDFQNGFVKGCP